MNDFDETLPGPFEYDVKRLAASFTIAARNNGFGKADARDATLAAVRGYRETMAEFAEMSTMDVWYAQLSETTLMAAIESFAAAAQTLGEEALQEEAEEGESEGRGRRAEEAHAGVRGQTGEEDGGKSSHARQPAGAVEARRGRRRQVPDHQPAADRRPDA